MINRRPTTTVEATGREWKKRLLISMGIVVGSALLIPVAGPLALIVFLVGLACILWASVGAWWFHG